MATQKSLALGCDNMLVSHDVMEADVIRTQVQLSEHQARTLKKLASTTGRSMADLVREGVDLLLDQQTHGSRREKMARAARAFGQFRSGTRSLSRRHDEHFADAIARR